MACVCAYETGWYPAVQYVGCDDTSGISVFMGGYDVTSGVQCVGGRCDGTNVLVGGCDGTSV